MDAGILQNPSDPDAAFREKAGKQHRGYAANVTEARGENGSIVTDYQYEQNTYSDSQFLKDSLEAMGEQPETVTVVTDGAYSSEEAQKMADANNIQLEASNLTGRKIDDIIADFEFNEDGTKVVKCPCGYEPKSYSYNSQTAQCTVMPVRGKIRTKFFFGCKIFALNFQKFCKYMQGRGSCAQNTAIT